MRVHLAATLGDTDGWLTGLIGYGGHWVNDDNGTRTYKHRKYVPRCYRWPVEVDRAVRELTQESYLGDVWFAPYVMTERGSPQG